MDDSSLSRTERVAQIALSLGAAVALYAGWRVFSYLCDDAYIAFRYVSNHQLGFGYVWNPPPFRPVEGYTSFLWIVVLNAVWTVFGADPTRSANIVSLICSYGSLGIVLEMAWRATGNVSRSRRVPLFGLLLFSIVSNRTFLAWTTSGLETPLETLLVLSWVRLGILAKPRPRVLFALTFAASMIALCRPDGLLFCAATIAMVLFSIFRNREKRIQRASSLLPLLMPIAHVLWWHHTYGFWLPNTYYAKHVAPWPIGGLWYLANFIFEYAYFVWVLVALAVAVREFFLPGLVTRVRSMLSADDASWSPVLTVLTLVAHAGYYTLIVGGDHFEYRVYHHLVPLLIVSFPWLTARLGWRDRRLISALSFMTALGLFLPWTHWWYTHTINVRRDQGMPHHRIAPHLPAPLSSYAKLFDRLQGWPMRHFIGLRHQTHKVFLENFQTRMWPTREQGSQISSEGFPVVETSAVGYPAWVLPHVAIIDRLGLNDVVAAHSPPARSTQQERLLAHDRHAPEEYLACFRPIVFHDNTGPFKHVPRDKPLTAEEIRACEETWWSNLGLKAP